MNPGFVAIHETEYRDTSRLANFGLFGLSMCKRNEQNQ